MTAASWREEASQDRLVRAQIDRDRDAARAQLRTAERQALAEARRAEGQARGAARAQARKARTARLAVRAAWVRAATPGAGPRDRGSGGAGVDRDGRLRRPHLRPGRVDAARVLRGRHVGVSRRHHSAGPTGSSSSWPPSGPTETRCRPRSGTWPSSSSA
jgi:hypothetical protein